MKTGTYRLASGELVRVTRTATGFVIRRANGETTVIGGAR